MQLARVDRIGLRLGDLRGGRGARVVVALAEAVVVRALVVAEVLVRVFGVGLRGVLAVEVDPARGADQLLALGPADVVRERLDIAQRRLAAFACQLAFTRRDRLQDQRALGRRLRRVELRLDAVVARVVHRDERLRRVVGLLAAEHTFLAPLVAGPRFGDPSQQALANLRSDPLATGLRLQPGEVRPGLLGALGVGALGDVELQADLLGDVADRAALELFGASKWVPQRRYAQRRATDLLGRSRRRLTKQLVLRALRPSGLDRIGLACLGRVGRRGARRGRWWRRRRAVGLSGGLLADAHGPTQFKLRATARTGPLAPAACGQRVSLTVSLTPDAQNRTT